MAIKKLKKQTRGTQNKKCRLKIKSKNSENVQEQTAVKPTKNKTLVIAQEIKFARVLAGNDKKARAKILKSLRSWLSVRSKSSFVFTESEFMRLWKGLYYCMWMSDKPLVQEELAESISHLIFCFDSLDVVSMYITCTLKTLSYEWFGIDNYRMDKFQMLVRRIIRQIFSICKKQSWNEQWVNGIAKVIENTLVDPKGSLGLKFHITEVYMEELAKISGGKISEDLVTELLRPFAIFLATMTDGRQISHVTRHIFRHLIFQSDVGMEYMEKFNAWRKAGFPTGSINAMQKVELSDDEENHEMDDEELDDEMREDQPLDPRAGSVNVDLPQVPFNPQQISKLIQQYKFHPSSTTKNRKQIKRLIYQFDELAKGIMPIGIKKIKIPSAKSPDTNPKIAAMRLMKFDDELYVDTTRNMNRKKKKLIHMQNGDSSDDICNGSATKKQKLEEQTIDEFECLNENEDSDGEVVQNEEIELPKVVIQSDKMKKKSLQKDFKVKNKKMKTKKLRSIKESVKNELLDGIDDFETFKSKTTLDKKKKNKYDFNNSWEVSSSECSPVVTVEKKSKYTPDTSATSAVEKLVGKKKIFEKTPVDKIPRLSPVGKKLASEILNQQTPTKTPVIQDTGSSSKKRVKIVLQRNTAQATSEYFRQLRLSPGIPFDANKKPLVGVLKPAPISSPLNPFYKKKL